jgi:hypothetical protein
MEKENWIAATCSQGDGHRRPQRRSACTRTQIVANRRNPRWSTHDRAGNLTAIATTTAAAMMILRVVIFAMATSVLAFPAAGAQAACQPTISEPCTPQPSADKSADQTKPSGSKKTNQPSGAPGGLRLTPDTGFGVDKGGALGPQRQFKGGLAVPF